MLDLSRLDVRDVVNNRMVCDDRGQNPRRVSSHIIIDFFGFDPEESTETFFRKLDEGKHEFQQGRKDLQPRRR